MNTTDDEAGTLALLPPLYRPRRPPRDATRYALLSPEEQVVSAMARIMEAVGEVD